VADAKGPVAYRHGAGFTIGSMQVDRRCVGTIDDVPVYNHVLTQAEMDQLARTGSATGQANVERKWS